MKKMLLGDTSVLFPYTTGLDPPPGREGVDPLFAGPEGGGRPSWRNWECGSKVLEGVCMSVGGVARLNDGMCRGLVKTGNGNWHLQGEIDKREASTSRKGEDDS